MNSERAQAYARVVGTIDELGSSKLLEAEQERIREAADSLVLAPAVTGEAEVALQDMRALRDHLVESGRWGEERAEQLFRDLSECGPAADRVPALVH